MNRTFKRTLSALDAVFDFVDAFARAENLSDAASFPVRFAAEEIFTNLVKYNSASEYDIELQFRKDGDRLVLEFIDHTDKPFDLSAFPDVDVDRPLAERKPGGLGIHLTKQFVDEVQYSFDGGRSRTTLIKYLEKK